MAITVLHLETWIYLSDCVQNRLMTDAIQCFLLNFLQLCWLIGTFERAFSCYRYAGAFLFVWSPAL